MVLTSITDFVAFSNYFIMENCVFVIKPLDNKVKAVYTKLTSCETQQKIKKGGTRLNEEKKTQISNYECVKRKN